MGAQCTPRRGLGGWFGFLSNCSACSGRNIAVFTSEIVLELLSSHANCFHIFAKPEHTSQFILERWGASGKDQLRALFLSPGGFGSSVYRSGSAVRAASTQTCCQE